MTKDLHLLVCPSCKGELDRSSDEKWHCTLCNFSVDVLEGKPFFQQTPQDIRPFEKSERGPDMGTPWRQANWKFLQKQINKLPISTKILDVGAGRGDFAEVFINHEVLAMDVIPFSEVDIICDLTQCVPFPESSIDAVVLMNVLEHVYDTQKLLRNIFTLLTPDGKVIISIPFMLKVHFSPYDFYRYTHHSLRKIFTEAGYCIESLEGYYDPMFFMGESIRNIFNWVLSEKSKITRFLIRALLVLMKPCVWFLEQLIGKGYICSPEEEKSPAAIGYLAVISKPKMQE